MDLVADVETRCRHCNVVFVSHGDTLGVRAVCVCVCVCVCSVCVCGCVCVVCVCVFCVCSVNVYVLARKTNATRL
jgi:hypothetical protein